MDRRIGYAVLILALAVLSVFAALGLARFGYSMLLPSMQAALGISNTGAGQVQSWNLLGYLLAVVAAGALASRYGARRVTTAALAVVALGMLVTGLLPTFAGACAGRFLAGVGGAGANVPVMGGLVPAWFAGRRRGLAAGVVVSGSSLGLMVTGPLVPLVLRVYGPDGWRLCWYLFAGMALGVCLLVGVLLRDRPDQVGMQPFGQGAGGAPANAVAKARWRDVVGSGYLWHLAAVYFAFGFSYIMYSTFFVKHLVDGYAWSQADAGQLWMRIGATSIASGFVWGVFSDRFGRRLALVLIFGLQGAGFAVLGLGQGAGAVYASAGLFALTAWSIPAVVAAIAGDRFGAAMAPPALGLVTLVFGLGQVLSPYTGGWLADATGSFVVPMVLAAAVAWAGALGTVLLPRLDAVRAAPGARR
jgi:MFS family permease